MRREEKQGVRQEAEGMRGTNPDPSPLMPRASCLLPRCERCNGPMFPDEGGDQFCLMCGERIYAWLSPFVDRLLDAMERQSLRAGVILSETAKRSAGRGVSSFELRVSSRDQPKPETQNSKLREGTRRSNP